MKKEKFKKPKIEIIKSQDPVIEILQTYYSKIAYSDLVFHMDLLPPSTNKMYEKSVSRGRMYVETSPEVDIFRIKMRSLFLNNGYQLKPKGVVVALCEFATPTWLNKDSTVKEKDSDNMIKTLMDSIQRASQFPDEIAFYHHLFKRYSKKDHLAVHLFDLPPQIYC